MLQWCKACKQMESQYQDAGKELAVDGLRVAQLDADAYDSFKKRYGVEEFPTLKVCAVAVDHCEYCAADASFRAPCLCAADVRWWRSRIHW